MADFRAACPLWLRKLRPYTIISVLFGGEETKNEGCNVVHILINLYHDLGRKECTKREDVGGLRIPIRSQKVSLTSEVTSLLNHFLDKPACLPNPNPGPHSLRSQTLHAELSD